MRRLIWSRPARRDLYDIANGYREIDPDLPLILLERIEHAPLVLLDYPEIGSPTHQRGLRKWPVRQTPFVLLYASTRSEVEIRRVVHASSDWQALRP